MADSQNDICGCCDGLDGETPRRIDNPPGLSAISYRVGEYGHFKESLLARLSGGVLPQLARLSTRADSDFSIALSDALATSLDVLSFYQERLANEHYLRTATERQSVQELAGLIGYRLAPGVAASTWLAFTLQESPGVPGGTVEPVIVPAGVRVQSVPGQNEQAQTFETLEPIEARAEWNSMPVQTTEAWQPKYGDTALWLSGVGLGVQQGDAILIVGTERQADSGSERWDIRVVSRVCEDRGPQRTRLEWQSGLGNQFPAMSPAESGVTVYVFRLRASLFGHNAPDPRLFGTVGGTQLNRSYLTDNSGAEGRQWANFSIKGRQIDLDGAYPHILPKSWFALVSNENSQSASGLAGYVELYRAIRVSFPSRRDFGLSGKITRLIAEAGPDGRDPENIDKFRNRLRETLVLAQPEPLAVAEKLLEYPLYGATLSLAGLAPGILAGRALAVRGKRACVRLRTGKPPLTLELDEGDSYTVVENDIMRLGGQPERQSGSEWVYVAPQLFGQYIGAGSAVMLRLPVIDRNNKTGLLKVAASAIELVPAAKDDPDVQEVVFVDDRPDAVDSSGRDRTTFSLSRALHYCYDRETARVNGNVAGATHGETVTEVLGSGDARVAGARFSLRQAPLTYVSAATPNGRASTLALRVNDLLWHEVDSLFSQGREARVYSLHQDAASNTEIVFGDGVEGARPPSGDHNIRAVYRKGLGVAGNVGSNRLTTLLSRPLGVAEVCNPEAATGGEDPEQEAQAKENAPVTVRTLERVVSVRDYQDFARSFAGIDKAHAIWIEYGPARGVFITVAGVNGAPVANDGKTCTDLQAALHRYGDPLMPIRLESFRDGRFQLRVAVKVAEDSQGELVLAAVRNRLLRAYSFPQRDFGQVVSVDEIAGLVHGVAGVETIRITKLQRIGIPPIPPGQLQVLPRARALGFGFSLQKLWSQRFFQVLPEVQSRLPSALPEATLVGVPQAAELLVIDENSLFVELMS